MQKHDDDITLNAANVSERFIELIPRDFAREHLIVSIGDGASDAAERSESEQLAVAEQTDPAAIFNIGVHLDRSVLATVADGALIAQVIDAAYGRKGGSVSAEDDELESSQIDSTEIDQLIKEADKDLLSTSGKGPVVRLVDAILFDALARSASDVHLQPLPTKTLVRYRLDGVLHTMRDVTQGITNAVISRIKVMGRMDIAERRVPQDGRASVTIGQTNANVGRQSEQSPMGDLGGRSIDLRISTLPTSYGERAVIRLLDTTQQLCELHALGMPADMRERYLACATRTNGIILVTGPTGSGKTTTLYSTLRCIGSSESNIMTIEDPIEYELSSISQSNSTHREITISQSQINPRKGVTFATGLRHILRQDPDVIMVGEIRDLETARIAIQSSLTGHLVFSTLHTNDAASAVSRLVDLGIEPYLVSASLSAVLAQRLVRTLHDECGGKGCDACFETGFKGRIGLYELLVINESLRELIAAGSVVTDIRNAARDTGMRSLVEEGQRLVREKRTTVSEVKRVADGTGGEF